MVVSRNQCNGDFFDLFSTTRKQYGGYIFNVYISLGSILRNLPSQILYNMAPTQSILGTMLNPNTTTTALIYDGHLESCGIVYWGFLLVTVTFFIVGVIATIMVLYAILFVDGAAEVAHGRTRRSRNARRQQRNGYEQIPQDEPLPLYEPPPPPYEQPPAYHLLVEVVIVSDASSCENR